ncbi:unnamed protein product [Parascedosporium putredinis]|uniref:Arylsulfotransferase n=1 Tax=Parascedosporium putredinis TaxID=1442378 RepID=A0A9P1H673_9PEZI|nr:unnamed protein product [Parascedosporium putredinis]CAI7997339.1 unnamed protein product [Parascedosporium putredinis]
MKHLGTKALLGSALFQAGLADWQFRSRSDLAPPRLNITIPATGDVERGYLFVAPFAGLQDTPSEQHGPRQAGPYILRDDGDLVWSGYAIYSIWSTNFQAARWRGQDVLFSFEGDHNAGYGHGHGHITLMDRHYETVRELRAGNHKLIYQPVARDLTAWGAKPEQQWIVNAIIQELDIATGKVLFEWASLDHVTPDEAILPINPGQAGSGYNSSDAWDYFHINSVDKDADGNYLISARDACSIHKINGTDGSIIWRLAGKKSSFRLGKGVDFCFQHHARWLAQEEEGAVEVISLYDNSAHGTEHDDGNEVRTAATSSGKVVRVDTRTWEAELGSTQILPNGNALVNWGSEGAVTEFLPDGTPVFHAYMDSGDLGVGVQNYRAFRFNWTGIPSEEPAIVSLAEDGGTTVYVSWNGDTETDVWRFYEVVDGVGSRRFLGEKKRTSFETSFSLPGKRVGEVVAEAVDERGRVLRGTAVARVEPAVFPVAAPSAGLDSARIRKPQVSGQRPTFVLWRWAVAVFGSWKEEVDVGGVEL